jgi:alanyl-tRNA synthetase
MPPSGAQVRQQFIAYFRDRCGHAFVPSSPVVPLNDPTLLFTNAGMNQFKDVFLGQGARPYRRAVNTQKCIRAGGKHNDLEDVGKDTYHHTFFEMLGNWSFGDYFKAEAIEWAWDLLTNVWKLPKDRLYVTIFKGDEKDGVPTDDEAAKLWARFVDPSRISRWGKKDNFWEMGETGPCGPCTEIHFDQTPEKDGGALVNTGDPRVIEIWNLVFIQFNRDADGKLTPLPAKHVDTGMGFERITRIIQNKTSNYDTDIWMPIFHAIEQKTGARPYSCRLDDPIDIAYRVIADHIRCLTMAITDGAAPGNEGRGYVLRRILRRAVRHAHQTLGVKGPVLHALVPAVVDSLGEAFPELKNNPKRVAQVVRDEEESFLRTLDRGIDLFDQAATIAGNSFLVENAHLKGDTDPAVYVTKQHIASAGGPISGHFNTAGVDWRTYSGPARPEISADDAFKLHDTYGFPIDLTQVMAEERGMTVDVAGYEKLMEQARELSRKGGKTVQPGAAEREITLPPEAIARLKHLNVNPTDDSDKHHARPITTRIEAIWNGHDFDDHHAAKGRLQPIALITRKTNYYAESGGQVGDTGSIRDVDGSHSEFEVMETKLVGGYVLHIGRLVRGHLRVHENVQLTVDADRRAAIRAHHTATHLLNLALREALGEEEQQKGSLVAEDRLRFDFSCSHAMTAAQIAAAEKQVNAAIDAKQPVYADLVPLEKARAIRGVRAVFGERYPDPVRVVSIGVPVADLLKKPDSAEWQRVSIEFCGGTHLASTDEARKFIIVREEALAAGVRRITAITGPAAIAADAAARELEGRLRRAATLDEAALAAEFDDLARRLEEVTLGAAARHRLAGLLEPLRERVKAIRRQGAAAAREGVRDAAQTIADRAGGSVIIERLPGPGAGAAGEKDALLTAMDVIRARRANSAIMLFAVDETAGKVSIAASVPKDLIARGLKAGDWVREAATACGGSGGGRPDMAQAGGKEPAKAFEAMDKARAFARRALGESLNPSHATRA